MEHTVNMNSADCIKSAIDWSVTHYTNICTGAQYTIENGKFDQLLAGSMFALIICGVGLIGACIFEMILD